MITALDYFSSLVQQDSSIPLFEAALAIAQDADPDLDLGDSQFEIDRLGSKLLHRLSPDASPMQKLRVLNHFFYNELGFYGNINDYYNPANSYLHQVLHSRRGLPISLAVIYMELAEHIALDVKGIPFPGHFLMKLSVQEGDIILDPFNGNSLSREQLEERLEPYFSHQLFNDDVVFRSTRLATAAGSPAEVGDPAATRHVGGSRPRPGLCQLGLCAGSAGRSGSLSCHQSFRLRRV